MDGKKGQKGGGNEKKAEGRHGTEWKGGHLPRLDFASGLLVSNMRPKTDLCGTLAIQREESDQAVPIPITHVLRLIAEVS